MLRSSVSCRKLRSSTLRLRSKFDFIQSKDAVLDNYEKMGFRSIGNQIVDASNVVNAVALQQYQSQYSIPAALKPKLPNPSQPALLNKLTEENQQQPHVQLILLD